MTLHSETAAAVLAQFGLGSLTGVPQLVARGAMGEVSRTPADSGTFAVKELYAWNPGTGVEEEVAFTATARAAGLRVPLELRGIHGEHVAAVGSRRFRVYEWLDLGPTPVAPVAAAVAADVGRIAATLHRVTEASSKQLDPWYSTPPAPSRWHELINRGTTTEGSWTSALAAGLLNMPPLAALAQSITRKDFRVCHRDLHPDNVLPLAEGGLAVLDWENLGPLEPEQEIGCLLVSWCTKGSAVDVTAVRGFIAGYLDVIAEPLRLQRSSFATAAAIWLNFVAIQAEAALDHTGDAHHRAFGESCVRAMLAAPMSVPLIDQVLAATQSA